MSFIKFSGVCSSNIITESTDSIADNKVALSSKEFKMLLHMVAVTERVICMDGLLDERTDKQIATQDLLKKLE